MSHGDLVRPDPTREGPAAGLTATVFGGTGFLGKRIVRQLLERGNTVRVVSRHPESKPSEAPRSGRLEHLKADIRDEKAVCEAVNGADAVVNAVSLYVEHDEITFVEIHVDGARRVAEAAKRAGASTLIHLSGIGADRSSRSEYIRCRAEGEAAVREAFPNASIFRPSVMFGAGDSFLGTLVTLVRRLPVIPLFGGGETLLQPVCADDVAEAAARIIDGSEPSRPLYELGGPEVLSYRAILHEIIARGGRRRLLLPGPFSIWRGMAAALSPLPAPPLTSDQVALMERDNVADPEVPGLRDLGIAATTIGQVLARDFALDEK